MRVTSYVGPDEGICFSRGADGKLTPNLARYPSGLRGLGDYIHQRGLKYALYTDAGTRTCSKAMPGTKDHEFEDMAAFAAWRADYVKVDWCNTEGQDPAPVLHPAPRRPAGRRAAHRLQPLFMGGRRAVEVGRFRGASLADHGRHLRSGESRLERRDEEHRGQRETVCGRRPRPLERPRHAHHRNGGFERNPKPQLLQPLVHDGGAPHGRKRSDER